MAIPPRLVKLSIINDLTCPNCGIGQYELMKAIDYCKDVLKLNVAFEIEYLPFRLISTTCLPENAPKVEKSVFFTQKLGEANFKMVEAQIKKWAEEKGVPISFRGVQTQSTIAHRLSRKAYHLGGQEYQLPLIRAYFKEHLEEAKDIGDPEVLADIAARIGFMTKEEALAFLASDELLDEVNNMCDEARSKGITGVPLTIIDGKWALSGGQCSEVFVRIFKKLADAGVHAAPSPFPAPIMDATALHQTVHQVC